VHKASLGYPLEVPQSLSMSTQDLFKKSTLILSNLHNNMFFYYKVCAQMSDMKLYTPCF